MSFSQSNLNSGDFHSFYMSGSNGVVCSASNLGLYYTTNSGQTWIQSNITTGNFFSVIYGSNGFAGSYSNLGLYYTTNSGQTWTQSNVNTGNFFSTYMYGSKGFAGSASNLGVYYSSIPICYEKNTSFLILENNEEKY